MYNLVLGTSWHDVEGVRLSLVGLCKLKFDCVYVCDTKTSFEHMYNLMMLKVYRWLVSLCKLLIVYSFVMQGPVYSKGNSKGNRKANGNRVV